MLKLQLDTLFVTYDRIAIRWAFTAPVFMPARFTLWRSGNAVTGWEKVTETDNLVWIDPVVNMSKFIPFFYRVTAAIGGVEVHSNVASIQNPPDDTVIRLQKRERFQLAKYDGVPAWLWTRKRSGSRCPRCTSSNESLGDLGVDCKLCFGTKIEGGYHPGVPIYVARQSLSQQGANLTELSVKESSSANLWTSNWTIIHPEDVIREAVPPNYVWWVTGLQGSERRRKTVRQLLSVNEVGKGSLVYDLPIPPEFNFPPTTEIFFNDWNGNDFDAMFGRLVEDYVQTLSSHHAADVTPVGPSEIGSSGGKKDKRTGFFS